MPLIQDKPSKLASFSFEEKQEIYQILSEFCTENKLSLFEKNIKNRTKHLTVVLEDIEHPHNASAVMRSCDCFGIQDLYILEREHQFKVSPGPTSGAEKWIDYHRFGPRDGNNLSTLIATLKQEGYKIIATMPHEQDCMVEDLDISEKTALVFGTEHTGISDEVIKHADGFVKMPMYGFTESYNISVCAALMLYATTAKMRTSDINWQLSPEEELDVKLRWQSMTIKKYDMLLDLAIKRLQEK